MNKLTHLDEQGRARMVDVSGKDVTARIAVAEGALSCSAATLEQVKASKPTADYDAKWGSFVIDGKTFARLVFAGV